MYSLFNILYTYNQYYNFSLPAKVFTVYCLISVELPTVCSSCEDGCSFPFWLAGLFQRTISSMITWLATVNSMTEKIKRRCVDSQRKSVKSCHSHPTPRIALFVRWFVCWWQNFSRIIDICTIHTFMLQEQGPGPYTYASGSRIEHRYMHHTYVYQDQGSWTCAWILVVVLFCGIIAG